MKRIILHPFIAVIMALLVASGSLKGQDLGFEIKLNKAQYNKGEPVSCIMTLKNTGTRDLVVNNRFIVNWPSGPHEISFQITDPGMRTVPFTSKVNASFESKEFILLKPGATESATYLLSKHFELAETGKYQVVAYYENKFDAPGSLHMPTSWKGSLTSNKVIFTIR